MKKLMALIIVLIMLIPAAVSCAPATDQLDHAITLASSDAMTKAEWLNERLDGSIPDEVIIGIGSSEKYGIDMTDFKEDGYIARAINDQVLLFGAAAEGLDRAVREYAKAVDAGTVHELDTVYHEGEIIENLTIAGKSISEYTVVYRDNGEDRAEHSIGNAKFAAKEFVRLVEIATGIKLHMKSDKENVTGNIVMIDYLTDGEHGENGFTYEVKDGNLYINGVGLANGCANGVYYFLEYECGWDGLICGDAYLTEVEALDVPNGTSADVDPMFNYIQWYEQQCHKFKSDHSYYNGRIDPACHGITRYLPTRTDYVSCYSNESNYLNVFDKVYTQVKAAVNAGSVIGVDITTIDVSMEDATQFCKCTTCMQNWRDENRSHAGSFVLFANRLAEDMENENLGGLVYAIFAYHGANPAPKTHTRDDVYVTFCLDGSCGYHSLEDPDCWSSTAGHLQNATQEKSVGNPQFATWIKAWGEVCDNLYVWYYALDFNGLKHEYTLYDIIYDDITFLHENNVSGFFFEMENCGFGIARVRWEMVNVLQWNPDLTEEEFNIYRDRILARDYGDGWENIHEFITLWARTEHTRCENIWGNDFLNNDIEMYRASSYDMLALLDEAYALANNSTQAANIERLFMTHLYRHCWLHYFDAYNAEDEELMAELNERWAMFVEFAGNTEFSLNQMPANGVFVYSGGEEYFADLNEEMWKKWQHRRLELTFTDVEERPGPEEWVTEVTSED